MALERTFGIVKPDAVAAGAIGGVVDMIEKFGLKLIGLRLTRLSGPQAEAFYAVHKERPFFGSLVEYMTSGPVFVAALERDNAVAQLRQLMGATDPKKADAGTIRAEFGESIEQNAIHGSDSDENAKNEIAFFFAESELV